MEGEQKEEGFKRGGCDTKFLVSPARISGPNFVPHRRNQQHFTNFPLAHDTIDDRQVSRGGGLVDSFGRISGCTGYSGATGSWVRG